ncbi:hypothetical protein E4K67_22505 [Desulfosporosinus fructosivorans]|uniref:Uncharacterized protein n=1 Tax=Desulfosporosinus fructosivorans TaxID=2018669 RepID=A0A4Z0QYL4_9FIRM|nr:hypothetical protein [Desulfosporosinus fructosivorans]TGE35891.1 hypothetical protein E4K67_22505 [Desulfosporosinus fructosivorans]
MAKCKYFDPVERGCKVNCANCRKLTGSKCKDHVNILREYEESPGFKAIDRMMRGNRGITFFQN